MTRVTPSQEQTYSVNNSIATGPEGAVYVTWMQCPSGGNNGDCVLREPMVFSRSTDGGATWSKPALMTVADDCPNFGCIPNVKAAAPNYPFVAVDNSNGPHSGTVYVAMYSWTGTFMRVQVIHSSDGGNTWSKPVPVAPPSAAHDQFFPALSVSTDGILGVSWLDRRNDPANIKYQAFAAFSSDGGHSFSQNVQLTTEFSNPDTGGNGLGDYAGNTWDGPNYFIAAWMDSSNGLNMQEIVGGVRLK